MKILITNSAFEDLESIIGYYTTKGVPHIGDKYLSEIIEHIQTLERHPEIGRQVPEFNTAAIREFIHPPFRIVYLKEEKAIHIVRVWRSERKLLLPSEDPET